MMVEYNPAMFLTYEDVESMVVSVDVAKAQSDMSGYILLIPLTIAQIAILDERAEATGLDRQSYILEALGLMKRGVQDEGSA